MIVNMETRSTMLSNCDQTIPRQAMPHIEGVVGPRTPLYHMCFLLKIDETQNNSLSFNTWTHVGLVYVGSTEIFRFLAIYKYLRASMHLIDAFSATIRSFRSPSPLISTCVITTSSPRHQANDESSSYCGRYSSNSISPGSSLFNSLPPRNACTKVRAFCFFFFFYFSF